MSVQEGPDNLEMAIINDRVEDVKRILKIFIWTPPRYGFESWTRYLTLTVAKGNLEISKVLLAHFGDSADDSIYKHLLL